MLLGQSTSGNSGHRRCRVIVFFLLLIYSERSISINFSTGGVRKALVGIARNTARSIRFVYTLIIIT